MTPKRIILIRHGESEGNVNPDIYQDKPDHRLSLTRSGCNQALEAGVKIKELVGDESIHYYVSPYQRSRETLKYLLASGLYVGKMFEDPRLREQDWGHFRSQEETAQLQRDRYKYGTFYYRFPNGESGADVFDRVSSFLETIYRDFEREDYAQNTVIVSHGLTVRFFLMRWFHRKVEEFENWENPKNCQFFVMEKEKLGKCYIMPHIDLKTECLPLPRDTEPCSCCGKVGPTICEPSGSRVCATCKALPPAHRPVMPAKA